MHNGANYSDISVPQVSLPKGGGAIKGLGETFQTNSYSGTGSLSIPIYTSPCRDFEPQLTLDYHSDSGNGPFGLGFSISVPDISRKTDAKPHTNISDTFVYANAEDLVPIKTRKSDDGIYQITSYQPRIDELFAKIECWESADNTYWQVEAKGHLVSVFGKTESARICHPDYKSKVFTWLLEETYDLHGNKIKYFYRSENSDNIDNSGTEQNRGHMTNKYIHSIRYGNYLSDQEEEKWLFEVIFDYGEYNLDMENLKQTDCDLYVAAGKWLSRQDAFSSFRSGFEIRTHRLCRNILMFHHIPDELGEEPCLVHATSLVYDETPIISHLRAVCSTGYRRRADGTYHSKSIPSLEFAYTEFIPENHDFQMLNSDSEVLSPGYLQQSAHQIDDEYGEGLPGIMNRNNHFPPNMATMGNQDGYAPPLYMACGYDLPAAEYQYEEELVTFVDLFGDGLAHRVRIRSKCVECWPNLGYGRFGPKILMENAPDFGDKLDASRLYLADVDGSGTMDLIYTYPDRIEVYINQSGNAFCQQPVIILLPDTYSAVDRISFGDINGNGASCLIFTKTSPVVKHYYYEFTGGNKPYLLARINNNMGALTNIYYRGFAHYYLQDKKKEKLWNTKLPFPVQVVEKCERIDQLSGLRHVTVHAYHEGYYDEFDRDFRGFGFVETWDTEEYTACQSDISENNQFEEGEEALLIPPVCTKRWYHTGNFLQEYYYDHYTAACHVPDSHFAPEIYGEPEYIRQAYRALKGQLLREEVFAVDNRLELSEYPYSVTETSFFVRFLQAGNKDTYPVFSVHQQENMIYHYECNPANPKVEHTFTLEAGAYGEIIKSCQVFYPRSSPACTEQPQIKAIALHNRSNEFDLPGHPFERKRYEISGLALKWGPYFSFDDIREQILQEAFNHIIPQDAAFQGNKVEARLTNWDCDYYWDASQDHYLPLGQMALPVLLHHSRTCIFTDQSFHQTCQEMNGNTFPDQFIPKSACEIDLNKALQSGGYYFSDGYWWNYGPINYYYKSDEHKFNLLYKTEKAFVSEDVVHFQQTLMEYDPYLLKVIRQKQIIDAETCNENCAEVDYISLQLCQIKDINNNITQAVFDPLGMVIATSRNGELGEISSQNCGEKDIGK